MTPTTNPFSLGSEPPPAPQGAHSSRARQVAPVRAAEAEEDLVLTEAEKATLEGLDGRDYARQLGRIKAARKDRTTSPLQAPATQVGTPLLPGESLDGKSEYKQIPLSHITPDPDQPRKTFRNIGELAKSLKEVGLKQPITVRPNTLRPGHYILMYGERRYKAAEQLNWMTIGAIVRYGVKDSSVLADQITENSQREDLDPIEEARGLRAYMRIHKIATYQEAGERLGHSLAWAANRGALLSLDEDDQTKVSKGEMTILDAAKKSREIRGITRKPRKAPPPPPHFGHDHPLAGHAGARCRAQTRIEGIKSHKRLDGGIACGECWEQAIRQDAVRRHVMNPEGDA
jgi:ParB/RepB/Spo0J family partition protein